MNLIYAQGASVEGRILRLMSRDPIGTGTPIRDPVHGLKFIFRMSQDSESEIEAEWVPREWKHSAASNLAQGDTLRAKRISGFSTAPIGRANLVLGSQNHRASQLRCNDGFAQIDIPLRTVLGLMASQANAAQLAQPPRVVTAPETKPGKKSKKAKKK